MEGAPYEDAINNMPTATIIVQLWGTCWPPGCATQEWKVSGFRTIAPTSERAYTLGTLADVWRFCILGVRSLTLSPKGERS
jgi:hypothetical protein